MAKKWSEIREGKEPEGTALCSEGTIWVCGACGRQSKTRYGFLVGGSTALPDGTRIASQGWDASCMLNAVLCKFPKTGTNWQAVLQ